MRHSQKLTNYLQVLLIIYKMDFNNIISQIFILFSFLSFVVVLFLLFVSATSFYSNQYVHSNVFVLKLIGYKTFSSFDQSSIVTPWYEVYSHSVIF